MADDVSHGRGRKPAEHSRQHQAFVYRWTPPEPHSGARQDSERREEEELPRKGRLRVGPRLERQVTEVAAQIESVSRLRDHGVDAGHGEADDEHGADNPQAAMNGGAARCNKRHLRQKEEKPCNCHRGMRHHQRRRRKRRVSPGLVDQRWSKRRNVEENDQQSDADVEPTAYGFSMASYDLLFAGSISRLELLSHLRSWHPNGGVQRVGPCSR